MDSPRSRLACFLHAGLFSVALGIAHIHTALWDAPGWATTAALLLTFAALAGLYRAWLLTPGIFLSVLNGAWAGLIYYAIACHWLGQSANPDPTRFSLVAVPRSVLSLFLFFPWWALAFGAAKAACLSLRLPRDSLLTVVAFALAMSLADLMLSDLVYGIPLAPLSRVLLDTPLAWLLPAGGMHLANLILIATAAALVWADFQPLRMATCLMVATALLIPHYWLDRPAGLPLPGMESSSGQRVFLAQPHLPRPATVSVASDDPTGGADFTDFIVSRIHEAVRDGVAAQADLIALPENIMPYDLSQDEGQVETLARLLPEGTTLVIGFTEVSVMQEGAAFTARPSNSAAFIGSGGLQAIYRKAHLVPFGETMPAIAFAMGFDVLAGPSGGYQAGERIDIFRLPDLPPFALLICYEAILSGAVSRETGGAHWLLNISSEGLFGTSIGPRLLLDYARMRSLETGLPMLRSTATAYSSVIDGHGSVIEALPLESAGSLVAAIPPNVPTLFRMTGYVPLYAILAVMALALLGASRFAWTRQNLVRQ